MALFITAMTINPSAKKLHPDLSSQISSSLDVFSKPGVTMVGLFATLGRYDYLAQFEAADQTVAFSLAAEINGKGILETETWPVIPYEEFTEILG